MFEKEAVDRILWNFGTAGELIVRTRIWEDGAEFGYNKANEWHFVKDGDLPKENQLVLLYRENPNGANVALTYWYKSYVNDKVIAWKEVIPPKDLKIVVNANI